MNKHTATDPNGQIHTRNSKSRIYTHTVVAQIDRASTEKSLLEQAEKKARNSYAFYCGDSSVCNAYTTWDNKPTTRNFKGKDYASGSEYKADYPTVQDEINYEVAQAQALIDSRTQEWYDEFRNLGWNSRLDLAEKLAQKETGRYHLVNVTILEATVSN